MSKRVQTAEKNGLQLDPSSLPHNDDCEDRKIVKKAKVGGGQVGIATNAGDAIDELKDVFLSYVTGEAAALGKDGKTMKKRVIKSDGKGNVNMEGGGVQHEEVEVKVKVYVSKKKLSGVIGKTTFSVGTAALGAVAKSVTTSSLKVLFSGIYAAPYVHTILEMLAVDFPLIFVQHGLTEPLNYFVNLSTEREDYHTMICRFGVDEPFKFKKEFDPDLNDGSDAKQKMARKSKLLRLALFYGYTKNPILGLFPPNYQFVGKLIGNIIFDLVDTTFDRLIRRYVQLFKVIVNAVEAGFNFMLEVMKCLYEFLSGGDKEKSLLTLKEVLKRKFKGGTDKIMKFYEEVENLYNQVVLALKSLGGPDPQTQTKHYSQDLLEKLVGLMDEAIKRNGERRRTSRMRLKGPGPSIQGGKDGDGNGIPDFEKYKKKEEMVGDHMNCMAGKEIMKSRAAKITLLPGTGEHDSWENGEIVTAYQDVIDLSSNEGDESVNEALLKEIYARKGDTIEDVVEKEIRDKIDTPPNVIPLGVHATTTKYINIYEQLRQLPAAAANDESWKKLNREFGELLFAPPDQKDFGHIFETPTKTILDPKNPYLLLWKSISEKESRRKLETL